MKEEIARKLIHISSLWIPLIYYFLEKREMLLLISIVTSIMLVFDYLRLNSKILTKFIKKFFSFLLREHEAKELTGASYFLIGCGISILFFTKEIAIFSILILIISDSAAALIGKKFGRKKYLDKTVPGVLAFFISGLVLIPIVLETNFTSQAILSVLAASVIEFLSKKIQIDDNLLIPLVTGVVMSI